MRKGVLLITLLASSLYSAWLYSPSVANGFSSCRQGSTGPASIREASRGFVVDRIKFVNKKNLWAVAHFAKPKTVFEFGSAILRSTDRGQSWETQLTDRERYFGDICFVNQQVGWICGDGGLLLKSTDGGKSWGRQDTRTESDLRDIQFIGAEIGWAMSPDGEVLRTTDGGQHWSLHGFELDGYVLHILRFVDSRNGWIAGEKGHAYESTDGGVTWKSRGDELLSMVESSRKRHPYFTDIEFITPAVGFIAARLFPKAEFYDDKDAPCCKAVIFKTENGGRSWSVLFQEEGKLLRRANFLSEQEFRIDLGDDDIRHTTDGGKSWISVPTPKGLSIMQFLDRNNGIGTRSNGTSNTGMYYTNDGGRNWKMSKLPSISEGADSPVQNPSKNLP